MHRMKRMINAILIYALKNRFPLVFYPVVTFKPNFHSRLFLFIRSSKYWIISAGLLRFVLLRSDIDAQDSSFVQNLLEPYDRQSRMKSGDVVFDAGASIGEQTIMYAKTVGTNGRVVAIEPSPERAKILNKNILINRLKNVTVIEGALWSSAGETEFEFYGLGAPGLKLGGTTHRTKVTTYTIDQIASSLNITKIDFLKMDIEGSECEALRDVITPIESMGVETHTIGGKNTVESLKKILTKREYSLAVHQRRDGLHILTAHL